MLTTMDKNQFDNIGYGFCIDTSPITTFLMTSFSSWYFIISLVIYEITHERIGATITHSNNRIPTNSLLVIYVPTSGGKFAGRPPMSCQSHTKPNKTMTRITVVTRSIYPASFHHWLPLYSFHAIIPPIKTGSKKLHQNIWGTTGETNGWPTKWPYWWQNR